MTKSQRVIIVNDIYARTKILRHEDGKDWLHVRLPYDEQWWAWRPIQDDISKSDSSEQSESE